MDLRERLRRHRKDARWIVAGLAILLVLVTAAFYLLQRTKELPPMLVANRVLFFVLWYVNVILILVILFVLIRNAFKLVVERYHRILGAKFKTKLMLTYIGLALIPVLLLFFISTQLFRGSIDRWLSAPMSELLPVGEAVAQELRQTVERTNLRDARIVLADVRALDSADQRSALPLRLRERLRELELDYLAVYEGTDLLHAVVRTDSPIADLPEPGRALLREAAAKGWARGQPPIDLPGALILAAASDGARQNERPTVVVAGRVLADPVAGDSRRLIEAAVSHRQLEVQQEDIKASYLLLFLMMTLLILLGSSWMGLYLARRVTVPIQALADGTRRISSGDLDVHVEVATDDELGVLVDSFNRMTAELRSNKTQLERSNDELSSTNQRLGAERALIAAVLENVAAGVISVDAEGRIFTANGAALAMVRQREGDVLGRPHREAWADAERGKLSQLLDEASRAHGRITREIQLALGGDWKTFEVKVTHMQGGSGVRVLVLEDLTDLIQAQQLAAWREAARRIAHEIKNPLTPIQLAAERLLLKYRRGDADLGRTLEEGVAIIGREVRTLQEMVDEFSRYARMPRPQPTRVSLAQLCTETVQLYRDLKPGVEIRSDVAAEIGEAWIDAEQIRRALINLLDNAVEATEAPGYVRVSAHREGAALRLQVADSGRGIPAESKEKLFLPHFSTKGRGTGLGLAIVHRIVTDHHGRITVEDNVPHGTIFTLDLPPGPAA